MILRDNQGLCYLECYCNGIGFPNKLSGFTISNLDSLKILNKDRLDVESQLH